MPDIDGANPRVDLRVEPGDDFTSTLRVLDYSNANIFIELRDYLIELKEDTSKIHSEIRSVILEKNIEQVKSDPIANELVRLLMSLFIMLEENSRVIETEDYYSFYVKEPIALTRNKYELLKKYKEKL